MNTSSQITLNLLKQSEDMKLILSGSTGLVGTEVIRQSLLNPRVTSLIALTRRPIDISAIAASLGGAEEVNVGKVKSVIVQDFMNYSKEVKDDLADVDACIWYVLLRLVFCAMLSAFDIQGHLR
jgi:hypothetical protein